MSPATREDPVPAWLRGLPRAPEYRPTESEFADPIAFLSRVEREAAAYGICKVIPPHPRPSRRFVFAHLNRSLTSTSSAAADPTVSGSSSAAAAPPRPEPAAVFTTRHQELGTPRRGRPPPQVLKQVWQSGEKYTLEQFEAKSRAFSKIHLAGLREPTPLEVESLFWKASSDRPIYIEYANDVPGSGFATPPQSRRRKKRGREGDQVEEGEKGSGWRLSGSPWNLQAIARAPGSLTRFMPDDVPGVTSPMVYIGMLFSWFAWHVEDHELHSLNYLHTGAPKTWYAVPGDRASELEEVIRVHGYGGNPDRLASLAVLGEKTTLMSPDVLVACGVPCCRLVQYPGEFVVTFPRAYHIGFSHAPEKKSEDGCRIESSPFVHKDDSSSDGNVLMIGTETKCMPVNTKPSDAAFASVEKSDAHTDDEDDLPFDLSIDSGSLTCVACGILGYPFMAILQPSKEALEGISPVQWERYKLSSEQESFSNVLPCFPAGDNVVFRTFADYINLKALAISIAEEIEFQFDCTDIPLANASKSDLHLINISIDDEGHEEDGRDWTSQMGLNLKYCAKLRKETSGIQEQYPLSVWGLFSNPSPVSVVSNLKWLCRKARTPYKVIGIINSSSATANAGEEKLEAKEEIGTTGNVCEDDSRQQTFQQNGLLRPSGLHDSDDRGNTPSCSEENGHGKLRLVDIPISVAEYPMKHQVCEGPVNVSTCNATVCSSDSHDSSPLATPVDATRYQGCAQSNDLSISSTSSVQQFLNDENTSMEGSMNCISNREYLESQYATLQCRDECLQVQQDQVEMELCNNRSSTSVDPCFKEKLDISEEKNGGTVSVALGNEEGCAKTSNFSDAVIKPNESAIVNQLETCDVGAVPVKQKSSCDVPGPTLPPSVPHDLVSSELQVNDRHCSVVKAVERKNNNSAKQGSPHIDSLIFEDTEAASTSAIPGHDGKSVHTGSNSFDILLGALAEESKITDAHGKDEVGNASLTLMTLASNDHSTDEVTEGKVVEVVKSGTIFRATKDCQQVEQPHDFCLADIVSRSIGQSNRKDIICYVRRKHKRKRDSQSNTDSSQSLGSFVRSPCESLRPRTKPAVVETVEVSAGKKGKRAKVGSFQCDIDLCDMTCTKSSPELDADELLLHAAIFPKQGASPSSSSFSIAPLLKLKVKNKQTSLLLALHQPATLVGVVHILDSRPPRSIYCDSSLAAAGLTNGPRLGSPNMVIPWRVLRAVYSPAARALLLMLALAHCIHSSAFSRLQPGPSPVHRFAKTGCQTATSPEQTVVGSVMRVGAKPDENPSNTQGFAVSLEARRGPRYRWGSDGERGDEDAASRVMPSLEASRWRPCVAAAEAAWRLHEDAASWTWTRNSFPPQSSSSVAMD
nr:unnamed protein product [Digitaria exilis]